MRMARKWKKWDALVRTLNPLDNSSPVMISLPKKIRNIRARPVDHDQGNFLYGRKNGKIWKKTRKFSEIWIYLFSKKKSEKNPKKISNLFLIFFSEKNFFSYFAAFYCTIMCWLRFSNKKLWNCMDFYQILEEM